MALNKIGSSVVLVPWPTALLASCLTCLVLVKPCLYTVVNSWSDACRVDQESLLRFAEIGWQLLHEWANWVLTCPDTPAFHPTFSMEEQKLAAAKNEVAQLQAGSVKDEHLKFLHVVKSSRAENMQKYLDSSACRGGRFLKTDLNAATKSVRALGVRLRHITPF